jgi:hypothetical protein
MNLSFMNRMKVPEWIAKPPFLQWILILLTLVAAVEYTSHTYHKYTGKNLIPTPVVIAKVAPQIKSTDKVEVALETPTKTIRVYPSGSKAKVKLPPEAIENANIKLTDSTVIKSSESPVQVSQVLDISTGETETYVQEVPKPWVALENRGAASIDYGFKRNNSNSVLRLNVRGNLVQLKGIHLGLSGSIYSDGDYFVGVGGEYKW